MAMPNLGLSKGDTDNIIAYLDAAAAGGAAAGERACGRALQGNADTGKELFTGVARFQNGGPPCMACHSTGGLGAWAAELWALIDHCEPRAGWPTGVNAFVSGLPTPTMKAVWTRAPADPRRARERGRFPRSGRCGRRTVRDMATRGSDRAGCCDPAVARGLQSQMAESAKIKMIKYGVRRPMMAIPTTG